MGQIHFPRIVDYNTNYAYSNNLLTIGFLRTLLMKSIKLENVIRHYNYHDINYFVCKY